MLLLIGHALLFVPREIAEEPDGDGEQEDGRRHLLQILLALLPGVAPDGLARRDPVRRELHHEREVVVLHEMLQRLRAQDGEDHAQQVDAKERRRRAVREERPREEDEDRQPARAGHERDDGDGDEAGLAALDRARGHDGRNIE